MTAIGFVVRLLYFLVAPFVAIAAAAVIPMTGVLVHFVLLLVSFTFIEALRRSASRYRLVERIARNQLRFEAFYREHPPRMFLYYVCYPLLLPYWLANRVARQEFALYRNFTSLGVVLLLLFGAADYALHWRPDIGFGKFLGTWIATFILQIFIMIAFLLPLSVTIVGYQLAGDARNVRRMLIAACLSIGFAILGLTQTRDTLIPFQTVERTRMRSEAAPERAAAAQAAALTSVWQDIRDRRFDLDAHGWLADPARARARAELTRFYRDDEAHAFHIRVWPADHPTHALLLCHQNNDNPPVWLAMTADGSPLHDAAQLPAGYLEDRPRHEHDPR